MEQHRRTSVPTESPSNPVKRKIECLQKKGNNADMLGSIVCKYQDFSAGWYGNQELNLMIRQSYASHSAAQVGFVNRKFWEWCAIAQALDERCKLRTGMKGLGFAV